MDFFFSFCFVQRVLGDMARTRKRYTRTDGQTDGRTDGRTDGHTPREEQYMSLAVGRHIIRELL